MTPTVSAVITTYNYARYIAPAIESVLAQTLSPSQIIVVDDGSTDETEAIAAAYASVGVRYVRKENGGAGSARNRGIMESNGELIAFLDADDRWLPDKLALQVEHLQRYPEAGLVSGSEWQVFESEREPMFLRRKPTGVADMYKRLLVENVIGNPSLVLARRACFERAGLFDESLRLGQDWEMWIRITRLFPVGVVDAPLICFMRHTSSLTWGQMRARYATNRLIQRRYIRPVRPFITRLRLLLASQSMNCYYLAVSLSNMPGQHPPARGLALAAFLLDPFYETRNKSGALFRALFGQAAFDRVRRFIPRRSAPDTKSLPGG